MSALCAAIGEVTQMKAQQAQIARLASEVTAIQTTLNAQHAPGAEVQSVDAQSSTTRQ